MLSGRQLESLLRLWTFLLSSACVCVCVNFDFLTCSFILTPWRNKKWVSCCDCFMLPDAPASLVRSWIPWRLVNSLLGCVRMIEEFSSESEWDATVGQSSGSPAIDNQAGM